MSQELAPPIAELLLDRTRLEHRVAEIAATISGWCESSRHPPVLVGVLKGSTFFLADLVRAIDAEVAVDFIAISSYQSGASQGIVRIVKDLENDVTDRDVVVVEDIVDTGFTLNYLRRSLGARHPSSLRAITLLDKSVRRIVPVTLELSGFDVGDVFVVGYGLDFQGRFRNVRDLWAVRDLARFLNDPEILDELVYQTGSNAT